VKYKKIKRKLDTTFDSAYGNYIGFCNIMDRMLFVVTSHQFLFYQITFM